MPVLCPRENDISYTSIVDENIKLITPAKKIFSACFDALQTTVINLDPINPSTFQVGILPSFFLQFLDDLFGL
jgi:hypothetical protein